MNTCHGTIRTAQPTEYTTSGGNSPGSAVSSGKGSPRSRLLPLPSYFLSISEKQGHIHPTFCPHDLFFRYRITSGQFNYWCSVCVGMTVLLRDILFPPPLACFPIRLGCLVLSVVLLQMLTFFYARKEWKTYSKANLWMIFIIDMAIALLYNIDLCMEPANEFTDYYLVEIWIRPTITYGLVACFVKEKKDEK
jgi:hypothetical protein